MSHAVCVLVAAGAGIRSVSFAASVRHTARATVLVGRREHLDRFVAPRLGVRLQTYAVAGVEGLVSAVADVVSRNDAVRLKGVANGVTVAVHVVAVGYVVSVASGLAGYKGV